MYSMCGVARLRYIEFFSFSFFFHLADSHPSYPPSMCVKREPHEASFAPFTPSSVGDSALADILPHQSSLSVDASTPSYPAHAHGPCYSQYTSQAFIAGTTLSIRPHNQIKIQSCSLRSVDLPLCNFQIYTKLKHLPGLRSHQSHDCFVALLLCIQEQN